MPNWNHVKARKKTTQGYQKHLVVFRNPDVVINGNNDAPDNTSGGYDGLGAINILTNSTYNWSITTT